MAAHALTSQASTRPEVPPVTPKFRILDNNVRDSKRKDKATTLARREIRATKYEAPAVVRLASAA